MAERRSAPSSGALAGACGFTLAEMLAALAILLIGITALIGALSASVAQRRTTDARLESAALCEAVILRIQHEAMRRRANAETDLDLEIVSLQDQSAPGFPGMSWSASTVVDETRPDVWLVRLKVRWLEEGEDVFEEFLRVLPRSLPLGQRVRRFREEQAETPKR